MQSFRAHRVLNLMDHVRVVKYVVHQPHKHPASIAHQLVEQKIPEFLLQLVAFRFLDQMGKPISFHLSLGGPWELEVESLSY